MKKILAASALLGLLVACRPAAKIPRPAVVRDANGFLLYAPPSPRPSAIATPPGPRRMAAGFAMRGAPGDLYADIVLGQPDFATITPNEIVSYRLNTPAGVGEDPSKTHLWIWDLGNNRLLRLDLASGQVDKVLGQPSFSSSSCNGDSGYQNYPDLAPASASSLCGVDEMVLSPQESVNSSQIAFGPSGAMFMADVMNNRVLKWCNPDTDTAACEVWGQLDFASRTPPAWDISTTPPTDQSLRRPQGVAIDPATGTVAVADTFNHRVVLDTNGDHRWDMVLGPKDFTTGGYYAFEGGLSGLVEFPMSVAFWNGSLYVSGSSRVLRFRAPFSIGMPGEVFLSGFHTGNIRVDPQGRGLWVTERDAGAGVRLYDASGNLLERLAYGGGAFSSGSIGFDAAGNVIGSGFFSGHDVVRFVRNADGTVTTHGFFEPGSTEGSLPNHVSSKGLQSPDGIEVWGGQMIVASFSGLRAYNGIDAVESWQSNRLPDIDLRIGLCARTTVDAAGRLYVLRSGFIDVFQLPLTMASIPFARLPLAFAVIGGGDFITPGINGIAASSDGKFLYLADDPHNRVLRIRDPLSTPQIDVIYGQFDVSGTLCNRGGAMDATTLCRPGELSLAPTGHLYVGDVGGEAEGNGRFLRFAPLPSDNAMPIFAPAAEKVFPAPQAALRAGVGPSDRVVVGYNPYRAVTRFPAVYDDPFGSSDQPSRYLADFTSWPQTHVFFGAGHLAQADGNRHRVLIYLAPFGSAPISTATVTVAPMTPTLTPTPPRLTETPMRPTPSPTRRHGPKKTPTNKK